MNITLVNLSAGESYPVQVEVDGMRPVEASAELVCGEMHAHNTFEDKTAVEKKAAVVRVTETGAEFTIPACSVMHIALR